MKDHTNTDLPAVAAGSRELMAGVPESCDARVTLSLVSHTNVGKTTLARTLLRRDVGKVLDQAHVTDVNEGHVVFANEQEEALVLWDTPGFGDTVRLLRRLHAHDRPLGWFLGKLWDRFTDRPLWCSQEALRNVQQEADCVLYLVNAGEEPEDAGYVEIEMQILDWIGRPALVVLNQTGPPRSRAENDAELARWEDHLAQHECVRGVLSLDAYSRSWIQEGELFSRISSVLPSSKVGLFRRLFEGWRARELDIFARSLVVLARHVQEVACDHVSLEGVAGILRRARQKDAMQRMSTRLQAGVRDASAELIALHGLDGRSVAALRTELEDFRLPDAPLDSRRAGVLGGLVGGAVSGLAADIMTGGLSLGGGMIAGSIIGALGSVGLSRGMVLIRGQGTHEVRFSVEFLERLAREHLLRYLAVAHHGRGRGEYRDLERPEFWQAIVDEVLASRRADLERLWEELASLRIQGGAERRDEVAQVLCRAFWQVLVEVFHRMDGEAAGVWPEWQDPQRFLSPAFDQGS